MGDSGIISDLNVINVTHGNPEIGEVSMFLTHPSGSPTVQIKGSDGAVGEGMVSVDFDEASASTFPDKLNLQCIRDGTFNPPGDLDLFNGLPIVGTWTLEVSESDCTDGACSGCTGDPDPTCRTLTSWGMEITFTSASCTADLLEPDGSSGQASAITSGTTQLHSICPAADQDWATFTLAGDSSVTLATTGPGPDNTRMWLRDSAGAQIEFDNDSGPGSYSLITRVCGTDPLAAGTYFVQVNQLLDNREIASYDLDLTVTPCCTSVVVSNTTFDVTRTFQACENLTVGPNVSLMSPGVFDFFAGQRVSFVGNFDADADLSSRTCGQNLCTTGPALDPFCMPCVTDICSVDNSCCGTSWDAACVAAVGTICGLDCP
ncbi:MAG: PPC domain-containing protein [Thermoanaerobaculia bacterium]